MKEHRLIGAFAIILLALCITGIAQAATVTVTWVLPTTNTDGSTIPATGAGSLASVRVEYGTCNGTAFGTKAGEVSRPGNSTTATLNLQPGTTCVRAFATNTYGIESPASNVASKVVDPPTPNAPQLTTIAAAVFEVVPNERTFAFDRGRQVGTVKLGLACDEDRTTGADFYALERPSRAVLTRPPRSTALVARCG
jgi:hypothetical protein